MKKVLKKTLAVLTAASMTLSFGVSAIAAQFPDVTEETYPWAIEAIDSMSDDGIIKGYEDGSFKPDKTVSKLESLVLISRILGVEDKINDRINECSWDVFGEEIDQYDLAYGQEEIAYLLMRGVLNTEELEEYIDESHRDDGLKRYEVAILLTKALGGEKTLKADSASSLNYSDTSEIPANAKKYVAYVTANNLMQGMENNRFAPNETVTRAQAAVVLSKLQDMTNFDFKNGVVSSVDQTTRLLKLRQPDEEYLSMYLTTDVALRYNGSVIGINDISIGYDAVVTYSDGKISAIDFTDALVDDIIYGSFVGVTTSSSKGKTVSVYVIDEGDIAVDTSTKSTFKVSDDCVVTFNTSTSALTSLKPGTYVKLTVKKGVVQILEAQNKDAKITGRIDEIILEPNYKLKIEENGGDTLEYMVASDVKVTRNGKSVSARDLLVGDSVTVNTTYGIIQNVTATSKSSDKVGVIKEVIISATPKLTVNMNGEDVTYYVTSDAKIILGGVESTFYDLRVGLSATLKLESDTVVSIESVISNDIVTWAGTVTLINESYGLIQLEFIDPATGQNRSESVYVKSNASIVDYETQKPKKLSAIKPGMKVNVTGTMQTGLFEAGTVIIIG